MMIIGGGKGDNFGLPKWKTIAKQYLKGIRNKIIVKIKFNSIVLYLAKIAQENWKMRRLSPSNYL